MGERAKNGLTTSSLRTRLYNPPTSVLFPVQIVPIAQAFRIILHVKPQQSHYVGCATDRKEHHRHETIFHMLLGSMKFPERNTGTSTVPSAFATSESLEFH